MQQAFEQVHNFYIFSETGAMPVYMDLHIVPGVNAKDVADAHSMDVLMEKEHSCKKVDIGSDKLLQDIPDSEKMSRVQDWLKSQPNYVYHPLEQRPATYRANNKGEKIEVSVRPLMFPVQRSKVGPPLIHIVVQPRLNILFMLPL
jgi:hypothetical protein